MFGKIAKQWPWLALALGLLLLHSQHQLNSDEGIILNAAWNILHGRTLYIESVEFIAPGAPYLLAGWWRIVGVNFFSAAALGFIVALITAVGLYALGTRLSLKRFRFLPPAAFVLCSAFWPLINHNAFSLAAFVWALYFFVRARTEETLSLWISAGLLSGLGIIMLQHKGFVAAAFFAFILIAEAINRRRGIASLLVWLGACGLLIAIVLFAWPPLLLYEQLIAFPLNYYSETNRLPFTLWWLLCAVGFGSLGLSRLGLKVSERPNLYLVAGLGLALLAASLPRPDANHTLQAAIFFSIPVALIFEISLIKRYDASIVASAWLVGLFLLLPRPLFDSRVTDAVLLEIDRFCGSAKVYAGPFMPGIYFERRSLSPIPYSFLIERQQTEGQFNRAAAQLRLAPPECAVLNYEVVRKFGHTGDNPVDRFFSEKYDEAGRWGNVIILKKTD